MCYLPAELLRKPQTDAAEVAACHVRQVTWLGIPGRLDSTCTPVRNLLISMGLLSPPPQVNSRRDEAGQLAREILQGQHEPESPRLKRTGSFTSFFGGSSLDVSNEDDARGVPRLPRTGSGASLFGGFMRTGSGAEGRTSPAGLRLQHIGSVASGLRLAPPPSLPERTSPSSARLDWVNARSAPATRQRIETACMAKRQHF
jgi:hypothetical protein